MSWTDIRSRAGNDMLSDTINSLIAQANMSEAVTEQITVSDKISPITILRSKLTVSDVGMMTCVAKPRNDEFVSYMPLEPDGKYVRLDMKFDHGGEYLIDHSYMNNEIEFGYDTRMPVLIKGSSDDGVTSGKISSILDGLQHYYRAKITPKISIKQMVVDGFPGFSFIYRNFPLSILNMQRSEDNQRAILADYIENDSVQYAIKIELGDDGRIFFFVRHNYQDYYLTTDIGSLEVGSNIPNYFSPDYNLEDYDASTEQFQVIYPVAYVDIGFAFDFTTKVMQIYSNGQIIAESSPMPAIPALANLSLWLPMSDGGGETVRDISGTNNHGSFAAQAANDKPAWVEFAERRFLNFDLSDSVKIPHNANLNNLTSFTVSFYLYLNADFRDPASNWKAVIGKKYSPFGNGGWRFFGAQGSSAAMYFEIKNSAGTIIQTSTSSGMTALERWYHITLTYDGSVTRIWIDGINYGIAGSAPGLTLDFATDMFIGSGLASWTDTARMKMAHLMFWKNTALTQGQIYEVILATQQSIMPVPYTADSKPPDFIPPQSQNLSLWLPMTEQTNLELVRDISGNNNHSNYVLNTATRKPTKTTLNGKPYLEFGDGGDYIGISKNATLNPLTAAGGGWTISCFMYLMPDYYTLNVSKILMGSGHTTSAGSFLIYTPALNNRAVFMDVRTDAAVNRFLGSGGTLMPDAENWVHIVVTYDGSAYKFYINGVKTPTTHNFAGDNLTNASQFYFGTSGTVNTGHQLMAHGMFWKDKALTLEEINEIYDAIMPTLEQPENLNSDILNDEPVFPPGYDEPATPPPPGTPYQEDFVKIYDNPSVVSPVVLENLKINKITVSDQTSIYNIAIGTPVSDPFAPVYDVPNGVQTDTTSTVPITEPYNLLPASSTGTIENTERAYVQRIANTNSNLYNTKPTDLRFYVDSDGDADGTVYPCIFRNDGSYTKFGAGIAGSSLGSGWVALTGTSFVDRPALAVNDGVGVVWENNNAGTVFVQRGGQFNHDDPEISGSGGGTPDSWQWLHTGSAWGGNNDDFSIAGIVKCGGESTGAVINPFVQISNVANGQYQAGETFPTGSPMINNKPHKAEFRVWRDVTIGGSTPKVQLLHLTSAGAIKTSGTLKNVDVSTLPTADPGVNNFTWEDINYNNAILAGEKIVIATTGLTTGKVKVMYNNGNDTPAINNYDTTRSHLVTRNVNSPQGFNTTITKDVTGKIWTGGNDFVPYIRLDHSRKRCGIKCAAAGSDNIGKKVTKVSVIANKDNNPIDSAIYCRIRSQAGVNIVDIGQVDSSGVGADDTTIEFLNTGNNYPLALGDIISIEYDQGTATDYIKFAINKNQFDGADTILSESLTATINVASSVTDRDLAAQVWIGGTIDPVARPARGFKINNNSLILGEAATEIRVKLKRTGTFGALDKIVCKIIKWTTKTSVITIADKLCNDISNSAFVEYIFQNTANSYPMELGDLILFEQNNGNSVTQFIEIQTSKPPSVDHAGNKDNVYTAMFEYNGTTYIEDLLRDVIGSVWIGGFMVFPDPSIPNPPAPYHYFHGWHFCASTTPDSGGIIEPSLLKPKENSFYNNIADQFRLYSKILTPEQFFNYFINRWTITGIGYGGTQVMGYDFVPYDEAL